MYMTSVLQSILGIIIDIFEIVYIILLVVFGPIFISIGINYIVALVKGSRRIHFVGKIVKRKNIFVTLLWYFPKRFIKDYFNRDPNDLDLYGVHIWCGEQGSGKSVGVVEWLLYLKNRYPEVKIRSNIDLKFQDGKITSWKDLILCNNGKKGQIEFLDEIQNWFSSNESKNFPVEMLQEITQQRKQRKIIVGTVQAFQRTAKPIREQTTLLYYPFTVGGCLTFVRVYKPKLDSEGAVEKLSLRKLYWFVHTDELRNSYDTYHKVERLSVVGFQPRSEQLSADTGNKTEITFKKPGKK
ncbi:MAG: hypothetical protein IKL70_03085 [Oscillospiraceae bacterium]|nr:hypothetical protein [Oscillospiraceae bacterium]